ncbi:MAG TPA: hypothetical protein VIT92_15660 [Burkholderiaceae bacterium]
MHSKLHHCIGALALAGAMPLCFADDTQGSQTEQEVELCEMRPAAYRTAAAPTIDKLEKLPVLADGALEGLRGGTEVVVNENKLSGAVTGNSAVNVNTGSNFITNGSFANSAGVPIVIQNSGANVLIQNATIINLQMK